MSESASDVSESYGKAEAPSKPSQKDARNGTNLEGQPGPPGSSGAAVIVQNQPTESECVEGARETTNMEPTAPTSLDSRATDETNQEALHLLTRGKSSAVPAGGVTWGWGGWGAMVAVIQDVATEVTGEISKTAAAAAKGIADSFDEEEKARMDELAQMEATENGKSLSAAETGASSRVTGPSKAGAKAVLEGSGGGQESSTGPVSQGQEPDCGEKAGERHVSRGQNEQELDTTHVPATNSKEEKVVEATGSRKLRGDELDDQRTRAAITHTLAEEAHERKSGTGAQTAEEGGAQETLAANLKDGKQQNGIDAQGAGKTSLPSDPDQRSVSKQVSTDFDRSVEGLTTNAMLAWATAWKGGISFVHTLEQQAETLAHTIQEGKLTAKAQELAPHLLEGGKGFAEQGMKMLEYVGKETVDILAQETGIELEKEEDSEKVKKAPVEEEAEEYVPEEEIVNFDHCYYIYGGPEHLEELEALSSHHELLCNRIRAKLVEDNARSAYDELAKKVRQLLTLPESDKGREQAVAGPGDKEDKGKAKVVAVLDVDMDEVASLRASSIGQAADLASRFTAGALAGLPPVEIMQKTTDRLEAIRSEGVHRISELCAVSTQHMLQIGNALISGATSATEGGSATPPPEAVSGEDVPQAGMPDIARWAEESTGRAEAARERAYQLVDDIKAVVRSFVTGIKDIAAAFQVATEEQAAPPPTAAVEAAAAAHDVLGGADGKSLVGSRVAALEGELEGAQAAALSRLQDGLLRLVYIILSTTRRC